MIIVLLITFCMTTFAPQIVIGDVSSQVDLQSCKLVPTHYARDPAPDVCAKLAIKNDKTISLGDSCFEISTDTAKFADAKTRCTKVATGHLANLDAIQIESLHKHELFPVSNLTHPLSYWIGLYQEQPAKEPNGQWYWLLSGGEKKLANQISWGTYEEGDAAVNPSDSGRAEDCATLLAWKGITAINDLSCMREIKYICEYN